MVKHLLCFLFWRNWTQTRRTLISVCGSQVTRHQTSQCLYFRMVSRWPTNLLKDCVQTSFAPTWVTLSQTQSFLRHATNLWVTTENKLDTFYNFLITVQGDGLSNSWPFVFTLHLPARVQKNAVWFVLLPRHRSREADVWSLGLEHSLRIQWDWLEDKCATAAHVHE